ncbi:TonB-dependent receptor [Oleiagrimonas sp. C23AA]|uniref:TonB-dependent receptor n=1 Tax=Oleiagrimonas sp. C23AA TaxID=2719047 RepID=UPI0014234F36|nr:TonB-dependent receptor [Oleiagrimonas sp. C23AA]NII09378.1 TonB-dependent receptor [Oleiagrimonas sp. C23AA]
MNQDKLGRFKSRALFTIVGGAVIINPAFAKDVQQPVSTPVAQQTSAQQANKASAKKQSKPASENDATTLSVVTVSGLRNSLEKSMDIKRDAIGVVDAISAEDIGKFPDTNLAESLQRVTGVSIDRRNGEGSQVTVRGFGPNFNMVTVDGRTIPGADAFGAPGQVPIGNVNGGTRSFNFAQLSPYGINALEVYKTGRANVASGGIGATIDIKTDRPFYHKGGKVIATVGTKGVYDTSEPFGNSVTPEFSGNFSYANPDKTWGIGIDASFSKRHGGNAQATENTWAVQPWTGTANGFNADTNIVNEPAMGQLYAMPNDVRYAYYDFRSKRKNAHAVFQLAPVDGLTMTLDYLYSRYQIDADRGEQSMWLQQQNFSDVTFDTGNAVATPTYIRDVVGTKDFGLEQQHYAQEYKLDDIGFNTEWKVNDRLNLTLDLHDAKSQSLPNDPVTGGGATFISIAGSNNCATGPQCGGSWGQEFFFNNGLPIATRTWYPTSDATGTGLVNQPFGPNNLGTQPLRIDAQSQTTEVKEAKLGGSMDFDNARFQFGTDFSKTKLHRTQAAQRYSDLGNWGVNDAGKYPDLMEHLRAVNTAGLFDSYNTSGIAQSTWIGNADDLAKWAASKYPNASYRVSPNLAADNTVIENTKAVYAQLVLYNQVGDMPTTTRFGLRYEKTNVDSTSQVGLPSGIVWQSNNDFQNPTGSDVQPVSARGSYSNLLPNIDFSINITDSLQGRASYSKTIARAPYGDLYAGATAGSPTGSTLINSSSQASGSQNDPGLKPLSSDNLDLGLGWYFAKSSYVSVTFWDKRVANFIGTSVTNQNLYGERDPTSGPRAQQAMAFLKSAACAAQTGAPCEVNDTSLFAAVALLSNPETGGLAAYNGTDAQSLALESKYDVTANPDDPLYTFAVSKPANVHNAMLHGWEFGGQYFLGETGFGILANYTIVDGNVHYNDAGDPGVDQFALTGLSDSANAVLMYEKYGVSVRLAWNWRGEFLTAANQNGNSRNPYYVDAYHQYDLSINYDVNDHLSFQLEGINLTGENVRWRARTEREFVRVVDQKPRYALGVRYKF